VLQLVALGYLEGSLDSVVVEALGEGALVGQAGQLIIGLVRIKATLYSWKANGTSFTRLRWFSGRSLRWRWDLE
jgi:hypothetical protein